MCLTLEGLKLEAKLKEVVKLYFEGYSVRQAIEVVRNETIQASTRSTR